MVSQSKNCIQKMVSKIISKTIFSQKYCFLNQKIASKKWFPLNGFSIKKLYPKNGFQKNLKNNIFSKILFSQSKNCIQKMVSQSKNCIQKMVSTFSITPLLH